MFFFIDLLINYWPINETINWPIKPTMNDLIDQW